MSTFIAFHNYGHEGWKPVEWGATKEFGCILDAVKAREHDVTSGGGETLIVEVVPVLEAYRRADYEEGRAAK